MLGSTINFLMSLFATLIALRGLWHYFINISSAVSFIFVEKLAI